MAVLITALIRVLALTHPHKLVEGVWTVKLAGCYPDYHANIQAIAPAWTTCVSGRCPSPDYKPAPLSEDEYRMLLSADDILRGTS